MLAPCSQFCALRATSAVTATALITSRRRVISVSGLCRSRPRGRISTRTVYGPACGVVLGSRCWGDPCRRQIAMIAGLLYTALRDAVLTHPTLVEGLITLFSSAASAHNVGDTRGPQISAA